MQLRGAVQFSRLVFSATVRPTRPLLPLVLSTAVLNQCNYVVLDEADRMIDLGFEPQVRLVDYTYRAVAANETGWYDRPGLRATGAAVHCIYRAIAVNKAGGGLIDLGFEPQASCTAIS